MKFIEYTDVNGENIQLSYFDYGSGKPVVLIHGWPSSKEMWEYQVEALVDAGLRVIAYDRRGFGNSSKTWQGYDYDTLTDDLKAVLDGLNLHDVTLVGFSMGGGEVARYATKYGSKRVNQAVLLASIVPFILKTEDNDEGVPEDEMNKMMEQINDDRIGFLESFGKTFFGINFISHPVSNPLLHHYLMLASMASPRATKECMKSFGLTDFREDAKAINVPTLIIYGDSDKIVPPATASQHAAKLIPNNQCIEYDGAPHGLFYTHKDRLNTDLISFIKTGAASEERTPYVILPSNDEGLVTRS